MTGKLKWGGAIVALALMAVAMPGLSSADQKASVHLAAELSGKAEVPGPGDPNGKGSVSLKVNAAKGKVCFNLEVSKLDPITAGHIHRGDAETAGPIKVTLFEDEAGLDGDGAYEGCVKKVKAKLLKKIGARPERFYVNIHNPEYPEGAIRGQLGELVQSHG